MYIVEMVGITKRFGTNAANDMVDFRVEKGEIHSLLGENGAGKTTLMNILFGMLGKDEGKIFLNGEEVEINSPLDAIEHGISMVHQHFMLDDTLTVAENIILGHEPRKGIWLDLEGAFEEVGRIADSYHFQLDPREKVGNLSVGVKQRVEIMKALYHQSDVLILDEPTAVLTPQEVDDLFRVLGELKAAGKTIIIITHKLKETMAVADSITVLRRGKTIASLPITEVNEEKLAELMVGHIVNFGIEKAPLRPDRPVALELDDIVLKKNDKNALDHLSLKIRYGEIYGIAGVEGNGQTELIEVLTGISHKYKGSYSIGGEDYTGADAKKIIQKIAHIPEDRKLRGFVADFPNWENLILGYHSEPEYMNKMGIMKRRAIRKKTEDAIRDYDIRTYSIDQLTGSLSGGNQQKLIVARVLMHESGIVLAAQPTRGVDIGAIEYIHGQLMALRDSGAAVILISADLDEIVKLSDTIGVLYEGKLAAEKPAQAYTETSLGLYMLGHAPEEDRA